MKKTINIIIPVLNEYESLDELIERLNKVVIELEKNNYIVDITFVDDGSEKKFKDLLERYSEQEKYIKVIYLTRNFGHQAALRAGIDNSSSDAVIMMDGDLQDPPELISEMVNQWGKGFDVVNAVRNKRKGGSPIKKVIYKLFYIIFSRSVDFSSTRDSGDFRLISKWIADEIKEIKEHNLFLRGYIDWLGGKKTTVSYVRDPRFGGKPKYGFGQLYKLAMNGLVSLTDFFPTLLIRVLVISFFAVMSIFAWVSYNVIFNFEILVKGWSSIILTLMISLLIQLFGFTFITFYLKKILEQTSGLKNYQIKKD